MNRTEQDLRKIEQRERELQKLMKENETLKKEMIQVMDKEKHRQEVERLRQQNKITEDRIAYLKDMERKLRQIVFDWRRSQDAEDKKEFMRQLQALLFKQKENQVKEKTRKKIDARYEETGAPLVEGEKVLMRQNNKVGILAEIRGKRAIVQFGAIPLTVALDDLVVVREKAPDEPATR